MANYADNCSPYEFSFSIEDVIQKKKTPNVILSGTKVTT